MSVEKVNKYKEEKANRKEILAKQKKTEKRDRTVAAVIAAVVVIAVVGAIGWTVRNQYVIYQNTRPNYDATAMMVTDLSGVRSTDEAADGEEAGESEEAETESGAESGTPAEEESEAVSTGSGS